MLAPEDSAAGFGPDGQEAQLLESGSNGCTGCLEPESTPELSIAPAARPIPGTVILVLKPDIAQDQPRLGVNDSP